ncbi:Planctomycete cytochrome C [Crateriforma conspicua]|nr:Planctomycete cytochrome C [Crateriforma conspicua]
MRVRLNSPQSEQPPPSWIGQNASRSGSIAQLSAVHCVLWTVITVIGVCPAWSSDDAGLSDTPTVSKSAQDFTLKVLPMLKSKCFGCHGDDPEQLQGDFDMRARAALLGGGESGEAAIVPGDPDESPLVWAIRWEGLEMPPKENDRLTETQVQSVVSWIAAGAPWPSTREQNAIRAAAAKQRVTDDGVLVSTSGGTSDTWTHRRYQPDDLWAYQPLMTPIAPVSSGDPTEPAIAPEHVIDMLVDAAIEDAGLTPAKIASPQSLIRRVTFDLTGLPPSPELVDAFCKDYATDADAAWEALIDRLLAVPHFGERQAQHWLDVSRYADTGGMSNDYERSNMWRYRDYVVRSFNEDKPYDQFIIEQIAGDELADQSVAARLSADAATVRQVQISGDYTPREAEWIIATGFLRLGPWDSAMIEPEPARQMYLDDVVNSVGQTFLSTTMRCVKCHDHKFDPIPTRDYYRLYATFATTQMAERRVPFLPQENTDRLQTGRRQVQRMLDFAAAEKGKLIAKREAAARRWFDQRGLDYQDADQRRDLPDDQKPPRHVGLDHIEQGQLKVREQDEWIWTRRLERYEPMAQSVFNSGGSSAPKVNARKLRIKRNDEQPQTPECFILGGGDLTAPGDQVTPGVLSVCGLSTTGDAHLQTHEALGDDDPFRLTESIEGRRLGLARWIAHPDNPLTTRSIVNRIWQSHFGRGIAANPNNFGGKGGRPTHPELLDYLAHQLVDGGWKLKRLHRMILLSQTYRRAAVPVDAKAVARSDPDNHWLSYFPPRRLSAPEIRDAMLAATGELNRKVGGLPVMPEINMEVALQPRMIQFSLAPAYQPSATPDQRNRRTIYAYRVRGQADPFLELFNQPNPNESCERRESSAVTPQAFTLMYSDMVTDRSVAMALRLQQKHESPKDQLSAAFRIILGRSPSPEEIDRLVRYIDDMTEYHQQVQPTPVNYPRRITRSLVEEFSGKPFQYQEILPVFDRYTPDVKPTDVDAPTRSLADACLLLFNTNEFLYLQ